jgi:hypothetical protein
MNPFRVILPLILDPRVVAALQPWAEVSERLRRYWLLLVFAALDASFS